MITIIIKTGNIISNFQPPINEPATNAKPDKIFSNAWPDVMLANRRTDKLIIRDKFEINSIRIIKGVIARGEPDGKKWLQKNSLLKKMAWNHKPSIKINAMVSVNNSWLVIVCEYGNKPEKFAKKITLNSVLTISK